MRAIWKGSISFGLVSIPVKLYTATEPRLISLKELCPYCHSPLKHKRWCPKCEKEIAWEEVVRGFEIAKDQYVLISKKELDAIKLKSTKRIEIVGFVDEDIEPIYLEKHYYLSPEEGGERAFSLLVKAMEELNKIAIGKVVMKNKEYVVALTPYKGGLLLSTLHYAYEIRGMPEVEEVKVSKEELELAKELIRKMSMKLDMSKFKDEYAEAFKEMIKKKLKGEKIEVKVEEREAKAKSLVDALKRSLKKR
ncbi:MAG TPA: Ku protein [Candidatus Aenigmarchaeota archaeon]|nr:Ku protein [Candidatus Aenigmarchaeota archaeon]